MSTGGSYRGMSESARPITALGATAQFQTYASAAYEPDANSSPLTVPPWSANLATSRGPFIQRLIDIAFIASAVVLCLSAACSIIVFFFMLFFVRL